MSPRALQSTSLRDDHILILIANTEEESQFCLNGLCYCGMLDELNLMILMIDSTSGERCYLEAALGFLDEEEMELVEVFDDHEQVDRLVSERIMSREDDQFLSLRLPQSQGFDFCYLFNNFERQRLTRDQEKIHTRVLSAMLKVASDKIKAKKDQEEEGAGNNALEVKEEDLSKALLIKHQIELTFL